MDDTEIDNVNRFVVVANNRTELKIIEKLRFYFQKIRSEKIIGICVKKRNVKNKGMKKLAKKTLNTPKIIKNLLEIYLKNNQNHYFQLKYSTLTSFRSPEVQQECKKGKTVKFRGHLRDQMSTLPL